MSALDNYSKIGVFTPRFSADTAKKLIHDVVWDLFDQVKDQSVRLKVLFFTVSVKLSKLEQVIVYLVGPR